MNRVHFSSCFRRKTRSTPPLCPRCLRRFVLGEVDLGLALDGLMPWRWPVNPIEAATGIKDYTNKMDLNSLNPNTRPALPRIDLINLPYHSESFQLPAGSIDVSSPYKMSSECWWSACVSRTPSPVMCMSWTLIPSSFWGQRSVSQSLALFSSLSLRTLTHINKLN